MTWIDVGANVAAEHNSVAGASQLGIPALSVRSDADTSSVADGDLAMLHVDEEGRLKISSKPPSYTISSGTVSAVNDQLALNVSRASNVMVHVRNDGATNQTAGAYTFEGSLDSTNGTDGKWFVVQVVRTNANTIETATGTLSINAGVGLAYGWESSVNGLEWFRVRCTTAATAGSTPVWTIRRGSYATEPIPAAQISGTQPVSGTLTSAGTTTNTPATPTTYSLVTAASTNASLIKGGAGTLYSITVANVSGANIYVKLFNKASTPTVGTDVPVITLVCPSIVTSVFNLGPMGLRFGTGIALCTTASMGAAASDVIAASTQIAGSYI